MNKWLTVLLTGILFLFGSVIGYGDGEEIKVISSQVGFDNVFRAGYFTPITVTVENNLKDINGEIQIEIPRTMGAMGVDRVYVYAHGINHPKGTTKKYTLNVPIPSSLLSTKLKIVEGSKVLLEQYIRIGTPIAENVMLAGIMSDSAGSLNYLNGFSIDNMGSSMGMSIVNLNEENFPADIDVMKSFNILFMNDFDSSKLKEEQYEVLKEWVKQGGFLIIGTGPNGTKTLSIFEDEFITGRKGELTKVSGKALGQFVGVDFNEVMEIMDIKLENGITLLKHDDIDLAQYVSKGRGRILILSFDMGLEPFFSWRLNRNFMEKMVQEILPSFYGRDYSGKYVSIARGNYYNIDRALKTIPELPLPNYQTAIIMFGIYIILAAPVSYTILKKRDRRELMWAVVPALSLAFAVIIYFMGFGTRFTGPIFNKLTIIHGDERGNMASQSFGGIFSPNKTDLIVESADGTRIKPLAYTDNYFSSYLRWDERKIDTKIMVSPKSSIEFYDVGVWDMMTISLEEDRVLEGNITSQVIYKDSGFTGFIENGTDLDLEDCYIITSNEYMSVGDIKSGDKKELAGKAVRYYGDRYDLLNSLYDVNSFRNNGSNMTNEKIQEIRTQNQKRYLLDYHFDFNLSPTIEGVKLIGWSSSPSTSQIRVNGKEVKSYNRTLVVWDLTLDIQSGEEIELPWGYIKPSINDKVIKGNYDPYSNSIYGTGVLEVSYDLGQYIVPERIEISQRAIDATIKQYIWNVKEQRWESGDFAGLVIQGEDIAKYVDTNNLLLFKFEMNDSSFQIPQITVKGRMK